MGLFQRGWRIVWRGGAIAIVALLVCEGFLRIRNFQPQNLASVGFSATVIDRWTDWSMTPNVRINEYTVTNSFGLHEDREVTLLKPTGMRRVAVVGSSVVWGIGEPLENTIPRHTEKILGQVGCKAEVLNFAGMGYNLLNASALVQTKVHQFKPDAIVVVMDLQMAVPRWPAPNPIAEEKALVRRLGYWEGFKKRASEYSVVLTAFDDVSFAQSLLAGKLPFPVQPKATSVNPKAPIAKDDWQLSTLAQPTLTRLVKWADNFKARESATPLSMRVANTVVASSTESNPEEDYTTKRQRELSSIISGMSSFANSMGIPLYFTTPYGPYFRFKPDEIPKFSLNMLTEASKIYGGMDKALPKEAALVARTISETSKKYASRVIDMAALSMAAEMSSGDFSADGIHFAAKGYRHVGEIVAQRLIADGLCGERGLQPLAR
jgi:lysophospholipase L1-like esterase